MKRLYESSAALDRRCVEEFGLSEAILMENAATKIERVVRKNLAPASRILFLIGGGNNAADALCAARKLSGDYNCKILLCSQKQNTMCKFQLNIAKNLDVCEVGTAGVYECYVDGIFGSGFKGELNSSIAQLFEFINQSPALKIAVDIPSGIDINGAVQSVAFKADITVTMGTRKVALFGDEAKDYTGQIVVANLGVSSLMFEDDFGFNDTYLLEKSDLNLPKRTKANTNKGTFGHCHIISGDMSGAAQLAALGASAMGSGLVSVVSKTAPANLSPIIMHKTSLKGADVVVAGCGLGEYEIDLQELSDKKCVIDADLFYNKDIVSLLASCKKLVITPHPKEFASLLRLTNLGKFSAADVQKDRFNLARKFSSIYKCVLVLKGANTIIADNQRLFVMPFGSPLLSKGGSGDVLSGVIASLLAQGYTPLNAAINATLAHALSVSKFSKNPYSLNPLDIIEGLKCL